MTKLTIKDIRRIMQSTKNLAGETLSHLDLKKLDLSEANLKQADLSRLPANLDAPPWQQKIRPLVVRYIQGVNLKKANLIEADLRFADLAHADLREANLTAANLRGTDLERANLRGAVLDQADLRAANLKDADLRGASLSQAEYDDATVWPDLFKPKQSGALYLPWESSKPPKFKD